MNQPVLAERNWRLLRSYENGPRIWDASAILPGVYFLENKGLIRPVGNDGTYELTSEGRARLEEGNESAPAAGRGGHPQHQSRQFVITTRGDDGDTVVTRVTAQTERDAILRAGILLGQVPGQDALRIVTGVRDPAALR